ncbi:unnamed protein product [Aphis gossypii]|uniref:Uncharacterized protein n=2 Tax=Aphis gossypii TaxID=80765 RepID=A0A9P0J6R4_APHGO|nr:unnamed protein product [Aphis gossypii]
MEENETVPLNFEVTAKNVLSNNIKLTPADTGDKTMELYFNTIMRVGERLKQQAEIKLNNEHDKALQRKVEQLLEEKNKVLNEKIRPVERAKYEKNLAVVVDEFNNFKFAKAKQCIKMNIMNKCKKEIENNSIMLGRCLKNILKMSAEKLEREMRNEFYYQMKIARSELYEEFMDEKRECKLCWEKKLKTVKEKNDRELKHLKVSMEAEYIQNLTELHHWYEIQKQKIILEKLNMNGTKS